MRGRGGELYLVTSLGVRTLGITSTGITEAFVHILTLQCYKNVNSAQSTFLT